MFIFHSRAFSVHQQRYVQINGASCFHEIQENVLWGKLVHGAWDLSLSAYCVITFSSC
jgi:hypothetical protein